MHLLGEPDLGHSIILLWWKIREEMIKEIRPAPGRFWTLNLIITRRVLYHCAAPVGTFTRNKTFPFRIPVFFLAPFQVLVFWPTGESRTDFRFEIEENETKKFFFKLLKITCQIKNFSVSYFFFFWKNKLSSNLLKLFSFLSLFYFGANYILFYFKTFLLLLLLRQFSIQLRPRVSK